MRRLERRNFEDVFNQMQKMFNQVQEVGENINFQSSVPVDIRREDDKVVLTADLPGVDKEKISLKADEDTLEISAETNHEIKEENEKYIRRERSSRKFRRTVSWPHKVDPETVEASYKDGVLEVEAVIQEGEGRNIEVE